MTADEAIVAALADWADLWDRRRPLPEPALRCPNCGSIDNMRIRRADGTVVCVECME